MPRLIDKEIKENQEVFKVKVQRSYSRYFSNSFI